MVVLALLKSYLHLGHFVAHIVLVMIEMLLEQIEQHRDMWRTVDILQLMATQFRYHNGVLFQFVEDIKQRNANIARQDTPWQQVVYQRCRGTLAFGASHPNGHVAIDLQEEVGETS